MNPTIKINNFGKRFFNYEVNIPIPKEENSEIVSKVYKGVARVGELIEIKLDYVPNS